MAVNTGREREGTRKERIERGHGLLFHTTHMVAAALLANVCVIKSSRSRNGACLGLMIPT